MFLKILKYDIRNSFLKKPFKPLIAAALFVIFLFDIYNRINTTSSLSAENMTFMDCCFCFWRGMGEYTPSKTNIFEFPAMWALFHFLILYFVLYYPYKDLMGQGRQVLVLSRSRRSWWYSKCITTVIWVLAYFVLAWLEIAVFCLCMGIKLSLSLTSSAVSAFVSASGDGAFITSFYLEHTMVITVFILPFLVTVGLALLQQLLSLIIRPLYSYIVTVAILLASAYYMNPFMIGNYAMTERSDLVLSNGVNEYLGLLLCAVLILASVIAGDIIFKRYDILNKE